MFKHVLFLDVDGVLNTPTTIERSPSGTFGIASNLALELERVVRTTNCDIVLSSTWRLLPRNIEYLMNCVGQATKLAIIDKTPNLGGIRGAEISAWLNKTPTVTRVVIVDDEGEDMLQMTPYLVKTNLNSGLTKEIADEIISRFKCDNYNIEF